MSDDGRIAVRFGGDALRGIEALASLKGKTVSEVVEAAVGLYVFANEKRAEGGRILHEDARGNLSEVIER